MLLTTLEVKDLANEDEKRLLKVLKKSTLRDVEALADALEYTIGVSSKCKDATS